MNSYHSILKDRPVEENARDLVHSPDHKLYSDVSIVPKYMVTIKVK